MTTGKQKTAFVNACSKFGSQKPWMWIIFCLIFFWPVFWPSLINFYCANYLKNRDKAIISCKAFCYLWSCRS